MAGLGFTSSLGSTMITYGASILSDYIEVGILQYMKSRDEGKSIAESLYNCNKAMFANREDIILGKTDFRLFDLDYIHGTKLASKVYFMASYCAYYKNGINYLTMRASGVGLTLSYLLLAMNICDCIKKISTRDYYNSGWELY